MIKKINFEINESTPVRCDDISSDIKCINSIYLDNFDPSLKNTISSTMCRIKKKHSSYRQQDIKQNRLEKQKFISVDGIVEKLVESKLKCFYCKNNTHIT